MGLLEKVEGTATLVILGIVGYIFIKNYTTLKELWCKIPGVCGISDCTLTQQQCWDTVGPYSQVDIPNCKCTSSGSPTPLHTFDSHGCDLTLYQHWCPTTGHCQDAASTCPAPIPTCNPCSPGWFRPNNDCSYPCMIDPNYTPVQPCNVNNGIGGEMYTCDDGSQKCYSALCPNTTPPSPGECVCSCGHFAANPRLYTGCGDQCDHMCTGTNPNGTTGCGAENPVGSGCYPDAVLSNCNINCNTRCTDVDGNYRPCQDPVCESGYAYNQWTKDCRAVFDPSTNPWYSTPAGACSLSGGIWMFDHCTFSGVT